MPAGEYRVIVTATEGRNEYAAPLRVRIGHGAVDTVRHLTRLEGYDEQEEYVRPPRDWRPLGIAALIAGVIRVRVKNLHVQAESKVAAFLASKNFMFCSPSARQSLRYGAYTPAPWIWSMKEDTSCLSVKGFSVKWANTMPCSIW